MLGESVEGMEKKGPSRQSSVTKPNFSNDRKNDQSLVRYAGRSKKRENGRSFAGGSEGAGRKPASQKNQVAADKRPRQRGYQGYRQREEVSEEDYEGGVSILNLACNVEVSKTKMNARDLCGFYHAPRDNAVGMTRNRPTGTPVRRSYKTRAYNKERYLQANCQFVVKKCGDYSLQATDPDALVDWDLIEQVRTISHGEQSCPICLNSPSAAKITRCGHIFCWPCILHYLHLDDKSWRKCPLCYEAVHVDDLKSVQVIEKTAAKVGEVITLRLMKKDRHCTLAVPVCPDDNSPINAKPSTYPLNVQDDLNTEYAKVLIASPDQIVTSVIDKERQDLLTLLAEAEPSEQCFLESALAMLKERETGLKTKIKVKKNTSDLFEQLKIDPKLSLLTDEDKKENVSSNMPRPTPIPRNMPRSYSFENAKVNKKYEDAFLDLQELVESENAAAVVDPFEDETEELGSVKDISEEEELDLLLSCSPRSSLDGFAGRSTPDMPQIPESSTPIEDLKCSKEDIQKAHCDNENMREPPVRPKANQTKNVFYFYQASDGQQIYLQSINARCLAQEYGNLEHGPHTITAQIVDKEVVFMSEETRKRWRYLSHIPLTCEFQVVEVRLNPPLVSKTTLSMFAKELKRRSDNRRRARREDNRNARRQDEQDRRNYFGLHPDMQDDLQSRHHFPDCLTSADTSRQRYSSLSDTNSIASPPSPSYMGEMSSSLHEPSRNDNASIVVSSAACQSSYANALSLAPKPTWPLIKSPATSTLDASSTSQQGNTKGAAVVRGRGGGQCDSEEDGECVPAPDFSASFQQAFEAAFKKGERSEENGTLSPDFKSTDASAVDTSSSTVGSGGGAGKKKKKGKKCTPLISNAGQRGGRM